MFSTHFKLAIAAEEENNTNEAFINFKKCYELDPSKKFTKEKYLSYFKKKFENENSKKSQDELKLIGNEYMQDNKFEEALIAYTAAIDLDPSVEAAAAIYSNRSLCYYNLEKYQEAYDDGCMASLLRPEWPRGWMRRATAGMKIENYLDAHECYEKYFELDPEGAKNDADVVRNMKLVKNLIDQKAANNRKKEQKLGKMKKDLLSTKEDFNRSTKAGFLFLHHASSSNFDADVLRLLIEHGLDLNALLPKSHFMYREWVKKLGTSGASFMNVPLSFFVSLRSSFHGLNTITAFDSVIRFLIDEMVKKNAPFPPGALGVACLTDQPNPDIILALLHTGKMQVNAADLKGFTPLHNLVGASNNLTPDGQVRNSFMASLHVLLNWDGVDVNLLRKNTSAGVQRMTPLMHATHPDVAKLLLRHGADVHAEGVPAPHHPIKINALTAAAQAADSPHQAELLRVLIAAGARLIVDGAEQKSSNSMLGLFSPQEGHWVSNDALQILLQLNKVQGLEMTFRRAGDSCETQSFLSAAVANGAPLRIVEQLCRWDPSVINEYSYKEGLKFLSGDVSGFTLLEAAVKHIGQNPAKYVDTLKTVKFLLDNGADLLQESRFVAGSTLKNNTTVFTACCIQLEKANLPLKPFYNVVEEKFGREYFEKCLSCDKNILEK